MLCLLKQEDQKNDWQSCVFCLWEVQSEPSHSPLTVHASSRAHVTVLFVYVMQRQPAESLCKDTLIWSYPLRSPLTIYASSRALMTRLFDYEMQHQAQPDGLCNITLV